MENLLRRGNELGRAKQQRKLAQVARQLNGLLRGARIEVDDAQILVSGHGIMKRWLVDPSLRFLSGGLP